MTGAFRWDTERTLIMGVLNLTPDSFSDGGRFFDVDRAVDRAMAMAEAGADIIDIGGESTRPGSAPVSAEEETRRIVPVIERLGKAARAGRAVPWISVDTTKSVVAERALAAGATIVNDISALRFDPAMDGVVRDAGAGLVLMHMRGTPQTMQQNPCYGDVVKEVRDFLQERVDAAVAAGIGPERIAIDPGIGFGKNLEHNLRLLAGLDALCALGRPVLVGVSRKSFIGTVLGKGVEDRIWGTAACVAWAVAKGAGIVRVHDVDEMRQVAEMLEVIMAAAEGSRGTA